MGSRSTPSTGYQEKKRRFESRRNNRVSVLVWDVWITSERIEYRFVTQLEGRALMAGQLISSRQVDSTLWLVVEAVAKKDFAGDVGMEDRPAE